MTKDEVISKAFRRTIADDGHPTRTCDEFSAFLQEQLEAYGYKIARCKDAPFKRKLS